MRVVVETESSVPPYRQLMDWVIGAVGSRELAHGERLPSVRELAVEALVNPNTVAKAYHELVHLGILRTRTGSGVFVTEQGPELAAALRRRHSLERFEGAVRHALRAGHQPDDLVRVLERLSLASDGGSATSPLGRRGS